MVTLRSGKRYHMCDDDKQAVKRTRFNKKHNDKTECKCMKLQEKSECEEVPECSICLSDITEDLFTTPCQHTFHKKCVDNWLKSEYRCPMCRTLVLSDEDRMGLGDEEFNVLILYSLMLEDRTVIHSACVPPSIFSQSEEEKMEDIEDIMIELAEDADIDYEHPDFRWEYSIS